MALFGVLFFSFVLVLIALCSRSATAAANLPGYLFGVSTVGLAVVLYLAYASFVILKAVCVLCVGTYVAVIGLFLFSGAATRYPMTSVPRRAAGDFRTLLRTPSAVVAALAFVVAAAAAIVTFPGTRLTAAGAASTLPALVSRPRLRRRRPRPRPGRFSNSRPTWPRSRASW